MTADGSLEDRQRTGCEFMLFDASDFVLAVIVLDDCRELIEGWQKDVRELATRLLKEFTTKTC